jgi:peptidoglycan LD-endopeptidase LytH
MNVGRILKMARDGKLTVWAGRVALNPPSAPPPPHLASNRRVGDNAPYLVLVAALGFLTSLQLHAQRLELVWPTPSTAYLEGKSWETFIQPTASGVSESGLFGCRRSGGAQFHEGIDIKAVKRDRQGEPADPVFAVMPGVIRHINRTAGDSSYGRYIVVEHPEVTPSIFTLYAHLARVEPGLKHGTRVERGQTIALMGRSASGYAIPRDRAHLHFEIGVWLTRDFQGWYNWKKFGSKNEHGVWNGMNLVGLDPLDFYDKWRARRVDNFQDYFAQLTPAVKLRIATPRTPDFVQRYPALVAKAATGGPEIAAAATGWEITFNEMGVPFRWVPLTSLETVGYTANEVRVLEVNEAVLKQHRCRSLAFARRGRWSVGRDLETTLQLLFGLRGAL